MFTTKPPIVDVTTIVGVESLFRNGPKDPFGFNLAGQLADLIIWSDQVRYILPIPSEDASPFVPDLFKLVLGREGKLLIPESYNASETPEVKKEHLEGCFSSLVSWASMDKMRFRQWTDLHSTGWIGKVHGDCIGEGLYYDIDHMKNLLIFRQASSNMDVHENLLLYALDISLRYPYYGTLASEGSFYLAHPVRSGPKLPILEKVRTAQPAVPISFCRTFSTLARHLTLDEYTSKLYDARFVVRDCGLDKVRPEEVTQEIVRDVAQRLELPAQLKRVPKLVESGGLGLLTFLASSKVIGVDYSPAVGFIVSLVSSVWKHRLPSFVGRTSWLNWAVEWRLEQQESAKYSKDTSD